MLYAYSIQLSILCSNSSILSSGYDRACVARSGPGPPGRQFLPIVRNLPFYLFVWLRHGRPRQLNMQAVSAPKALAGQALQGRASQPVAQRGALQVSIVIIWQRNTVWRVLPGVRSALNNPWIPRCSCLDGRGGLLSYLPFTSCIFIIRDNKAGLACVRCRGWGLLSFIFQRRGSWAKQACRSCPRLDRREYLPRKYTLQVV